MFCVAPTTLVNLPHPCSTIDLPFAARLCPACPTQPPQPRMESCLRAEGRPTSGRITFAGRPPSASTATGFGEVHAQEQAKLISEALDIDYKMPY